jgi:xanthine dehydrogenase accessory factor
MEVAEHLMNLISRVKKAKANHDTIEVAREWLDEYGRIALATVISTWGSAPVPVGGQLVVAPGERFEGSVSGGCIEIDVIGEAPEVMATGRLKLLEFGISDEVAWRSGLSCGGTIKILVESLNLTDAGYLDSVLAARHSRTTLGVVTNLATGSRHVFEPSSVREEVLSQALSSGESKVVDLADGQVFLHVLKPSVRIIAVGATHVGQVLADLAGRIGYDVIVVDPRTAFASEGRLGETSFLTEWPENSFKRLPLDNRTAVVALTHAAHLDDEAVIQALRSDCLYIGALGSKKTHAKRLERLRQQGIGDEDLARIRAPVGLSIGAKGPAEIAVSILAEIIKTSHREF